MSAGLSGSIEKDSMHLMGPKRLPRLCTYMCTVAAIGKGADICSVLSEMLLFRCSTDYCPAVQVLTYGLQNNDPAWVRHQYTLGVQGAIVDDVEGVVSAFGRASAVQSQCSQELAPQI